MANYLVITQYGEFGDAFVKYETNDLDEAKTKARMFALSDKKDAHTFIVIKDEWEDGNYNEIEF